MSGPMLCLPTQVAWTQAPARLVIQVPRPYFLEHDGQYPPKRDLIRGCGSATVRIGTMAAFRSRWRNRVARSGLATGAGLSPVHI